MRVKILNTATRKGVLNLRLALKKENQKCIYTNWLLYNTDFKLQSMFCGEMYVKIIDNTQVTIQPYVCFNLVVHRPRFQKNIGLTCKIFI